MVHSLSRCVRWDTSFCRLPPEADAATERERPEFGGRGGRSSDHLSRSGRDRRWRFERIELHAMPCVQPVYREGHNKFMLLTLGARPVIAGKR